MSSPPVFLADLHVHTCLSPCADWEMSPRKIIQRAGEAGMDILAICDHNSAGNAPPLIHLGKESGITVFPGMEICTREEVHILALFDKMKQARTLQEIIHATLEGVNNPEIFGYQILADKDDYVLGEEPRLLLGASSLTLNQTVDTIHNLQGLAIAAHIDRPAFGILGQLGFIPPDLALDAVEISPLTWASPERHSLLDKISIPSIVSSDAHSLKQIGRGHTIFKSDASGTGAPRLVDISKALRQNCFQPQAKGTAI